MFAKKTTSGRGTSNHIAEDLERIHLKPVAKAVQNFRKCLQACVREQGWSTLVISTPVQVATGEFSHVM